MAQLTLPQTKMEAGLYQQLKAATKRSKRNLILTRIENWASQGIPDLLICDEVGKFHFVELKFCKANAVNLSPHQIAWHVRHKHSSCWTLIKKQNKPDSAPFLFLYHADQAMDLKADGLKTEPRLAHENKFLWEEVFSLICPI
jgi:hypothetical protein